MCLVLTDLRVRFPFGEWERVFYIRNAFGKTLALSQNLGYSLGVCHCIAPMGVSDFPKNSVFFIRVFLWEYGTVVDLCVCSSFFPFPQSLRIFLRQRFICSSGV